MDDLARLVGERLRAARQERGLSLGALAEAARVGKGSLSEIENGVRNPTLGTLYALAGALGVPLAALIADRPGGRGASPGVHAGSPGVRAASPGMRAASPGVHAGSPGVRAASPGIEARLLDVSHEAGPGGGQTVEVYRLRLEPGCGHRSPAHGPGVTEHLLVTSGRARAGRLGEEAEVGSGQAAQWVSDVPHGYTALGPDPVESVLVIRSPVPAAPEHALCAGVAGLPGRMRPVRHLGSAGPAAAHQAAVTVLIRQRSLGKAAPFPHRVGPAARLRDGRAGDAHSQAPRITEMAPPPARHT